MGAISNLTRMLSTAFERRHQQSSSIPLTPANFAEQAQQPHRRQEPTLWSAVIDKITGQNKRFNTPAAAEQTKRPPPPEWNLFELMMLYSVTFHIQTNYRDQAAA